MDGRLNTNKRLEDSNLRKFRRRTVSGNQFDEDASAIDGQFPTEMIYEKLRKSEGETSFSTHLKGKRLREKC